MTDAVQNSRRWRATLISQPLSRAVQSSGARPATFDRFEANARQPSEIGGTQSLRVSSRAFQVNDARLLSIDGGGVFGIIPARILQYIEEKTGRPIRELFHMISATSTGGIVAAGVAVGIPCKELVSLYLEDAQQVFSRTEIYKSESADGLLKPKFTDDGIQAVLKKRLGDVRLDEAQIDLVLTAHDLNRGTPKFFGSWDPHYRYLMRDCVRATSAAAPVLPPAVVQDLDETEGKLYLIDGAFAGLTNPITIGLAEAYARYPNAKRVSALSLGTGDVVSTVNGEDALQWGSAKFALPLIKIMSESPASANDFIARRYLTPGKTFFRINPPVRGVGSFDDGSPANMKMLLDQTETYIEANKDQLDTLCAALMAEVNSRQTMMGATS
ncbi:MAG: patatin-like phospholipase family protein [Clostridia bacterium]|nr:patatin-like phospholipase family protein [Deltaproteobacteria bacterium]